MMAPSHDIRVSLSVDGVGVENLRFDCDRATVSLARRDDGKVTIVFSRDNDDMRLRRCSAAVTDIQVRTCSFGEKS